MCYIESHSFPLPWWTVFLGQSDSVLKITINRFNKITELLAVFLIAYRRAILESPAGPCQGDTISKFRVTPRFVYVYEWLTKYKDNVRACDWNISVALWSGSLVAFRQNVFWGEFSAGEWVDLLYNLSHWLLLKEHSVLVVSCRSWPKWISQEGPLS